MVTLATYLPEDLSPSLGSSSGGTPLVWETTIHPPSIIWANSSNSQSLDLEPPRTAWNGCGQMANWSPHNLPSHPPSPDSPGSACWASPWCHCYARCCVRCCARCYVRCCGRCSGRCWHRRRCAESARCNRNLSDVGHGRDRSTKILSFHADFIDGGS